MAGLLHAGAPLGAASAVTARSTARQMGFIANAII